MSVEYPPDVMASGFSNATPFVGSAGLTFAFILGALMVAGRLARIAWVRVWLAIVAFVIALYVCPFELSGPSLGRRLDRACGRRRGHWVAVRGATPDCGASCHRHLVPGAVGDAHGVPFRDGSRPALLGLATAKVFLVDLASLDVLYRVLVLVALGVFVLFSAFLYEQMHRPNRPQRPHGA